LLALVIVLLLVPICYIGYVCGKKQFSTLESAENQKRYTKYLQDVMVSRETAQERKLFDFDTYVLKKWNQNYRGYLKAENRTAVKNTINMESTGIIINVLFGMILTAFAFMYFEKKVQIGIIVGILSQVVILASSLRWGVMNAFMNYSYNRQMEKKITQFLNIQDRDDERGMEISSVEQVEFLNVFFKYPGSEEYVLNNISFCINKGKSYAFVGENGSGKTTIFKLLLKQYDSYEGTIKVNGIDIRNISAKSLHAAISVVYQDYSIYPVSLVDNVITEFSWDKDKFEKTLSAMGVENLIKSMPENEHTILGKLSTDDVTLSGGLSQKIAICRSLYQNGSLFILDEPTASLDPVSELNTFSLLLNEIKDKTRIIICHRMGVAKLCDEILVLDQGALVESGNNSELYEKRGKYYEMYETQKKWYV
jgi:ATP-binding cassette subfamily B protein